jgi:hypothetical protein
MFTITSDNKVQYNNITVKSCPNQAVALQTAINLSHKYGQLAEFQVEAILLKGGVAR